MTPASPSPDFPDFPGVADTDRVHVSVLLDRSGSMASVVDDTIGGFNSFIKEQASVSGDCRVTLVQFDSQDVHDVVFDAIPPREVMPLTAHTYQPRGGTPLLDAVGSVIQSLDKRVAVDPGEVQLVAIITDGYENSSRRFSKEEIAGMVTLREKGEWTFVFMGADIDAYGEASTIGIAGGRAARYDQSSDGMRQAFSDLSGSATTYRAMSSGARRLKKETLLADAREENRQESQDENQAENQEENHEA